MKDKELNNIYDFVIENGVLIKYSGRESVVVVPEGIEAIGGYAFHSNPYIQKVVIPDSVVSIGHSAFSGCTSLNEVVIPDELSSIPESLFLGCTSLAYLILPSHTTNIGKFAFKGCSSITDIAIPSGVTRIEMCTFEGCTNLVAVTIPDGVTDIDYKSFFGCEKLESVVLPNSVINIGEDAFSRCKGLKRIIIPNSVEKIGSNRFSDCSSLQYTQYENAYYLGDDSNPYLLLVKANDSGISTCEINKNTRFIGCEAFLKCVNLANVVLPDGLKSIEKYAFALCTNLSNINIPSGVKYIGEYAFRKCDSLTNVNIPGSVIKIGIHAFSGCKNLGCLIINDGVSSIGWHAFSDCSSLRILEIPDSIANIEDDSFLCCTELVGIKVPSKFGEESTTWWAKHFPKDIFPLIALGNFGKDVKLTKYVLKDKALCVKSILKANRIDLLPKLFEYAKTVDLHILKDAIQMASEGGMVEAYAMLMEYKNKSYPIEVVEKIEQQTFEKEIGVRKKTVDDYKKIFQFSVVDGGVCIKKYLGKSSTVEIPDMIGKHPVISIYESAFTNASQIILPESIKSISSETFRGCKKLKYNEYDSAFYLGTKSNPYYALMKTKGQEIELCEIHPDTRLIAEGAFKMHSKLRTVSIPKGVTDLGDYKDDEWHIKWAFADCKRVAEIIVSEANTSYKAIDGNLYTKDGKTLIKFFPFGKKRKNITIADGVVSIGDYAFDCCEKIVSVIIPEGVVSVGKSAFKNCGDLSSVVIPDSMKSIEAEAFMNCNSLESIDLSKKVTSIGEYAFWGCSSLKSIELSKNITNISKSAFGSCKLLVNVAMTDNVTSIEACAFSYCERLSQIELSKNIKSIGCLAFGNCKSLINVTIPKGMTRIEGWTFSKCINLQSVTIPSTVIEIGDNSFENCPNVIIKAEKGSYAEKFAIENNIPIEHI